MTKSDVLAYGAGREDVADLDLVARDDDAIDQQFDQLPSLIEAGVLKPGRDPLAKRFERGGKPEHFIEVIGFHAKAGFLCAQGRVPRLDLGAATLVLGQRDDTAEIGLGQPLELPGQGRLPLPQMLASGLKILRMPAAGCRPTEGLRHDLRVAEQLAEVTPDQVVDGPGWNVSGITCCTIAVLSRA